MYANIPDFGHALKSIDLSSELIFHLFDFEFSGKTESSFSSSVFTVFDESDIPITKIENRKYCLPQSLN